jgi:soluble cytochrome b562
MFIPSVRIALIALACAAPASVASFARAATEVRGEDKKSELAELMDKMGGHFKALKKNAGNADKKDANVADFTAIAELAVKCKAQVPETVKTDEDKKQYADMMDELAATAKAGATASADGKIDEAKKAFGEMRKLMGEGHKKFKKED